MIFGALLLAAGLAQAPPPHINPAPPGASSPALERWRPLVAEASRRFGVPAAWISAVMHAESGGQLVFGERPITSRAGAMGLMQLMPQTWMALRARYGFGADPYVPRDNILAGAAYLRALYIRYGYPNLFAAYNAGPARLDAHLLRGSPLPTETRAYLVTLGQSTPEAPTPIKGGLFFSLRTTLGGSAGQASLLTASPQ